MTAEAFGATILGWHDFFLAAAGATAALLGLLFVGVSINLNAIAADERVDLRTRAGQAFANLIFVLVVSLIMLIPDPDPRLLAAALAGVAVFGLVRVSRSIITLVRERDRFQNFRSTLRRTGWTAIADAVLAVTAWRIWESGGQAAVLINLAIVVFVLLIGAADISWEMLTDVSREPTP
jgi:hypothetical protein